MSMRQKREQPQSKEPAAARDEHPLVEASTAVYGVMTLAGLAFCLWGNPQKESLWGIPLGQAPSLTLLLAGTLGTGILLVLSMLFEQWFPTYRASREAMVKILDPLRRSTAAYLALISAIGEEFLFRAAIQPFVGILFTSVLSALLHFDPDGRLTSWSFFALLAGMILGWIFSSVGSLPTVVAIHFLVNMVSMWNLRRRWLAREAVSAQQS